MASRKVKKNRSKKTRKVGKRLSKWTDFVKKIHAEMKVKDSTAQFKDAMQEASRRKHEM